MHRHDTNGRVCPLLSSWLCDHLNDADAAIEDDMKELETHIKNDLEKLAQLEGA